MGVSQGQYANARAVLAALDPSIQVVELSSNDSWARDCGPTVVKNDATGEIRGVDWDFNAWGGLVDGLYFPWDQDSLVSQKICELAGVDSYRTEGFVLEGGSIHVDGEGTVLTTEMCLLSEGRNPHLGRAEIEQMLAEYLNIDKVIWLKDGIDPDETNGHIDDVACFVAPGEVACIYTDDVNDPFYEVAQASFAFLSEQVDAKGRKLKVHKLCTPKKPVTIKGDFAIDAVEGTIPREDGEICIASYMNFLITTGGVIVPQYGDENDALALQQIKAMFPERKATGVFTREIVYGGGNIHCITQHQPR
jgi:agmatine deiminase